MDMRVKTGPTVTHFDSTCAQTMLVRQNFGYMSIVGGACNGRVMASRCNNSNKRRHFCQQTE